MGRSKQYDNRPYDSARLSWASLGIELKKVKPSAFINKYGKQARDAYARTCSVFGCGRILSLTEQLHGTKCINHQSININHDTQHNR